jgi:cobalamin biosynthesis protein CobD
MVLSTELILPLLAGIALDALIGDPERWPHPIIAFGKAISWGEKRLNQGEERFLKGAMLTLLCVGTVFAGCYLLLQGIDSLNHTLYLIANAVIVFFCLAAHTLIKEVRNVNRALAQSLEQGRIQVARIVGRDTSNLNAHQIRTAALETLAENLSDGVIAPLFWFALLGAPGMLAYKMVNTLDSMIGYKNERYMLFGRFAAKLDDAANWIPARLTGWLMLLVAGQWKGFSFVRKYGRCHSSPNSGYPEAALAAILDCRFGGPNVYFGKTVEKPYIGTTARELTYDDFAKAIQVNVWTQAAFVGMVVLWIALI